MTRALSVPRVSRRRLSPTLSGYIARQYAFWYVSFVFALSGIILLASTVDLFDRMATKKASLAVVLNLVFLKLPYLVQEAMPFTILLAGLTCFWRLTRSHELVVTRATGISIWQTLLPVLAVAILVGALTVAALNPFASALLARFERLESEYSHSKTSALAVSRSGLWLRQADPQGQSVIHAQRVTTEPMVLHMVIVFRFGDEDRFVERIDAARAQLSEGQWTLFDAWHSRPSEPPRHLAKTALGTDLTREKILESFAPAETISFWSLPSFIALLEGAGFSAVRHKLQLHRLWATPLLFVAMVLLAAAFSLRPQRRGRVALVILGGVLTGFLFYFVSNFVFALGLSAKIPVVLAAWTPAGVALMLGIATLLHLEDG